MFKKRLQILPERPSIGSMKPLSSAQTTFEKKENGQIVMTIEHDTIRGVIPRMLLWWFENLSDPMEYEGKAYSRYLLWHPRDHIHWEVVRRSPDGGTGQGAYFRIVEAFGANPAFAIDSVELVEKLDEEGISLVRRVLGVEVFRLEHRFGNTQGGASYRSRMVVGMDLGRIGKFFNLYLRPKILSDDAARAWLTHNVEEVSMFEHILPMLYKRVVKD
jgi:hypothetical protein